MAEKSAEAETVKKVVTDSRKAKSNTGNATGVDTTPTLTTKPGPGQVSSGY